jgi:hypothetical protein
MTTILFETARANSTGNGRAVVNSSNSTAGRRMIPVREVLIVQPDEDAWYWSPGWQAAERAAEQEFAEGAFDLFDSVEDLLAAL